MNKFEIIGIKLSDVISFDKIKYNSNNHWNNNIRPIDYEYVISLTHTSYWIDIYRNQYHKIIIDNPKHIDWMIKAWKIGKITKTFSKLYSDELEETVYELNKKYGNLFDDQGYFVRTENVSLKYGIHGVGPYYDIKTIIESIVTSTYCHSTINSGTTSIQIYLLPWLTIEPKNEFRIFVFNEQITAISQQNLYSRLFNEEDNENIIPKLKIITDYFNSDIKNKVNWMKSYVIDFALIDGSQPYMIEFNPFGKEYTSGSALFHWIIDKNILYNDSNKIQFRYVL